MTCRFHPATRAEHFQTMQFYASRSKGWGGDYLLEFEAFIRRVMEGPHRYRMERKPAIRRVSLMRFSHKVIYQECNGAVQVMAAAHKRQRPDYWSERI